MTLQSPAAPYSNPNSSVKSSTTMEPGLSETRDTSFYFPGCKKDAHCKCEICIASMNATLDLMPQSIHRSSLTKLSVSRPAVRRSPVSYPSPSMEPSTPESGRIRPDDSSPPSMSTESMGLGEKVGRKEKRKMGYAVFVLRLVLALIIVSGVDFGFSLMVSRALRARLSPDLVMALGKISRDVEGINGRFAFLKNELEGYLEEKVSSCSSVDSVWKISQDGLLLESRCVMYKSLSEEVSIWGWPLQTAGLLTAQHSDRSFSILSGRVTEWNNSETYFVCTNSSWTREKWSSSIVQLDPNTWILEYRRSFFLENSRIIPTAINFLKLGLMRKFEKLKQEFWLPLAFTSPYLDSTRGRILVPT
ncbi:sigma non-opioid intracellular receptor 1 [Striga asiatica]|uniref:Sigma non-opioid intracellular receptor 1 n=1 Tax=Striga asiatica TaxID=4170 RepID=A0A5A7Q2W7_STRAF|nr:sigma non-opioid intracellular receptor 1 [Striga asiatica]